METSITAGYNVSRVFPWLKYLSAEQITEFYADFFNALEQALQEKKWSVLEDVIESWRATAEILAAPDLTAILTQPSTVDDLEAWDDVETELFNSAS